MNDEHIYVPHPQQFAEAKSKAPAIADRSGNRQVIHRHPHDPSGCPWDCVETIVAPARPSPPEGR
jgi:hypothetical protein